MIGHVQTALDYLLRIVDALERIATALERGKQ
jgi:hypothetical protein